MINNSQRANCHSLKLSTAFHPQGSAVPARITTLVHGPGKVEPRSVVYGHTSVHSLVRRCGRLSIREANPSKAGTSIDGARTVLLAMRH